MLEVNTAIQNALIETFTWAVKTLGALFDSSGVSQNVCGTDIEITVFIESFYSSGYIYL